MHHHMLVLNNQETSNYVRQRPEGKVCLAFVMLTIRIVNPVRERSRLIAGDIIERVTSPNFRGASLFLGSFTVTITEHGFKITFWCKSGTVFSTSSTATKNCAEVAVFEYSKRVLKEVQLQGNNIAQTEISYMTDLSPCPDCTRNIPNLKQYLENEFRNIEFSYKEAFVFNYQEYSKLSREEQKEFNSTQYWIQLQRTWQRWA